MRQTLDKVIKCVTRPPSERFDAEIEELLPWLQKLSQLFQLVPKEVGWDLLRNCQYQKARRDDVIIKQGDVGDSFYVILSGSVVVYIDSALSGEDEGATVQSSARINEPKDGDTSNTDPAKSIESINPLGMFDERSNLSLRKISASSGRKVSLLREPSRLSVKDGANDVKVNRNPDRKLNRNQFGKFIIKFEAGKCFGEIALISDDSVRNATIIADEDVDLLVVHRDLYNRSLKVSQEAEYADRKSFADNHPFFSKWNLRFRRLLEMSIRREIFSFDSPIVRQGEPVYGLVFIRKGAARVVVEPTQHKRQYKNHLPFVTENDPLVLERLREPRKYVDRTQERPLQAMKQESVLIRRRDGYAKAERRMLQRTIALCTVDEGDCIGDIEMYMDMPTYMQTVICTARTEVYILDSKNFERLVTRKNPATLESLKFSVVSKLRSRAPTQQGKHVPLLKHLLFKLTDFKQPEQRHLPRLKNAKRLPESDVLDQVLLDRFIHNKSALVRPLVPGSFYYMSLMEEKARIRKNISIKRKGLESKNDGGGDQRHLRSTVHGIMSARIISAQHKKSKSHLQSAPSIVERVIADLPEVHDNGEIALDNEVPQAASQIFITEPPIEQESATVATPTNELETVSVPTKQLRFADEVLETKAQAMAEHSEKITRAQEFSLFDSSPELPSQTREHFMNALVRHKMAELTEQLQGNEFTDFETSDASLSFLERRVGAFLQKYATGNDKNISHVGTSREATSQKQPPPRLTPLKRFEIDERELNVPKPGGRVMVRRKECRFANCPYLVKDHSHVKYHVVGEIPEIEALRKKKVILNFFMRKARERKLRRFNVFSK
ncbi:uncharacterized protein LOC141912223 [Tubulanus polymorphus]|uniref:uncharacterized protein LOC141912223 n=1 Tax=Tubulanus polymorphus TaxID=672921 RepID=UPI003DA27872